MNKVNNMPSYVWDYKYVVAREVDGDLWFWGAYDDLHTATTAANEIGGVVIEVDRDN